VIGEPYSKTHSFDNYIKGSPDTLFKHQGLVEQYQNLIPKYPIKVYDYYRLDRLVVVNKVGLANQNVWNAKLSEISRDLGKKKQVNIGVVVVFNQPHDYFFALDQAWLGGKKNDVFPVIGVDDQFNIQWVEVLAWAQDPIFKIKLRDSLIELKTLDVNTAIPVISSNVDQFFQRKPMKDFAYLKASITPSKTELIISLIIGTLCSIGLGYFFKEEDVC
jgi:hypothetical protein